MWTFFLLCYLIELYETEFQMVQPKYQHTDYHLYET